MPNIVTSSAKKASELQEKCHTSHEPEASATGKNTLIVQQSVGLTPAVDITDASTSRSYESISSIIDFHRIALFFQYILHCMMKAIVVVEIACAAMLGPAISISVFMQCFSQSTATPCFEITHYFFGLHIVCGYDDVNVIASYM